MSTATDQVEYRQVQMTEFRLDDEGSGRFSGYANLHNTLDSYDTFFTRTTWEEGGLDETAPLVLLDMHRRESIRDAVGMFSVRNDDKGLWIEGEFAPTTSGQDARALAKMGVAPELSVGFKRLGGSRADEPGEIAAAKLIEVSLILRNMASQPGAELASVRYTTEGEAMEPTREDWQKRYMGVEAPDGSFEQITAAVTDAVEDWAKSYYSVPPDGYVWVLPIATFTDRIAVCVNGSGIDDDQCWQFAYVMNEDETVTLGNPVAVELVTTIEPADADDPNYPRSKIMQIKVPPRVIDMESRKRRAAALRLLSA